MDRRLMGLVAGLGAVAALTGAESARADVISADFYDSADAPLQTLTSTATVGAFASTGWQNIDVSPTAGRPLTVTLNNSTGAATTAQLGLSGSGTALNGLSNDYIPNNNGEWNATATTLTPTQTLFNGYIQVARNSMYTIQLALSNIPYSSYNIYVYTLISNSGSEACSAQIFSGGTAGPTYYLYHTAAWNPANNLPTTYVQSTATTLGTATQGGNYFLFSGLSGSTQAIDVVAGLPSSALGSDGGDNSYGQISGIQIVAAPEPASLAVIVLGGGGLLLRRRSRLA